jgi:hypothetical protein
MGQGGELLSPAFGVVIKPLAHLLCRVSFKNKNLIKKLFSFIRVRRLSYSSSQLSSTTAFNNVPPVLR